MKSFSRSTSTVASRSAGEPSVCYQFCELPCQAIARDRRHSAGNHLAGPEAFERPFLRLKRGQQAAGRREFNIYAISGSNVSSRPYYAKHPTPESRLFVLHDHGSLHNPF